MRPLSATECISPAIERTKLVLFSPFRKGRTWKLSATAYLYCGGTQYFPAPIVYLAFIPLAHRAGGMLGVTILCAVVLLLSAFFTWLFHLCSRLQFAFFDIVVNRGEFVAPAWRKYRSPSLRWTGFKVLAGTALTLVCAAPIVAYVRHLFPLFRELAAIKPGQPPPMQFIAAMYGGYAVVMLIFGLLFLISSLLADFIVPSLALENTSLKEAFRRMAELIRREPGEFAIFVLLKIGLGLAAYMGSVFLWEILFLLSTLILGAVVFGVGFLLHLAGVPQILLIVLGVFLAIAWYLFALIYSMMLAIGPGFTFLEAYSLYFLGGRYPMLGDLLDQSTPPPPIPAAYPAPLPYPSYPPPPPQAIP
jgi:hypothetical protein